MKNLASIVSRRNVELALEQLMKEKPALSKATKYYVEYKGHFFPPKEVIRYAALKHGIKQEDFPNYRLQGGPPSNGYLQKLGFKIVQFADWKRVPRANAEKRIARICWNTNGWIFPSGKEGKSRYRDSHEAKFGYGHEEWLFDIGKTIDGYHYGFLEPVRKQQEAFLSGLFDIWLYTIDGDTKTRYWAGELFNVEVLTSEQADKIKNEYTNRGWLKKMEEQIRESRANSKGFSNYKGLDLFNIRFKVADYRLNEPYIPLPGNHPVIYQSRYSFGRFREDYRIQQNREDEFRFLPPGKTVPTKGNGVIQTGTHTRKEQEVQIVYLHAAISKALTKKLEKQYGKNNVTPEHPAGYDGNRIDIIVKAKKGLVFYEIKTYPSMRTSVRHALGQLIEYAMWPNKKKASELIIITPPGREAAVIGKYMAHLRDTLQLPLYWQSFDAESGTLSEKY